MTTLERDFVDAASERAAAWYSVAMIAAVLAAVQSRDPRIVSVVGVVGLVSIAARLRRLEPPGRWLPTLVTLARAASTGALVWAAPGLNPLGVAAWIYALFCVDGLDGWLARRLDAASRLGARIDMESDGFLVMVACLLLHERGLGLWILTPGLLRYVYGIATTVRSAHGEIPRSRLGRYAFAVSVTGFSLAFFPLRGYEIGFAILGASVLTYSFARSFYWSFRARAAA